jgi:hypothetical protein
VKPIGITWWESETQTGNHFDACLASLLELPLAQIPQFSLIGVRWCVQLHEFLWEQGYIFKGSWTIQDEGSAFGWLLLDLYSPGVNGCFICSGALEEETPPIGKTVIYKKGQMIHDPSPSQIGLSRVVDALVIEPRTTSKAYND